MFWTIVSLIDVRLLLVVQACMEFLTEWLSVRQRPVERALIAAYAATFGYLFAHDPMNMYGNVGFVCWFLIIVGLHLRCDHCRLRRLSNGEGAWLRVLMFLLNASFIPFIFPPFSMLHAAVAAFGWLPTVLLYLTALPETGEQGRRRRKAIAELQELFSDEPLTEGGTA